MVQYFQPHQNRAFWAEPASPIKGAERKDVWNELLELKG